MEIGGERRRKEEEGRKEEEVKKKRKRGLEEGKEDVLLRSKGGGAVDETHLPKALISRVHNRSLFLLLLFLFFPLLLLLPLFGGITPVFLIIAIEITVGFIQNQNVGINILDRFHHFLQEVRRRMRGRR